MGDLDASDSPRQARGCRPLWGSIPPSSSNAGRAMQTWRNHLQAARAAANTPAGAPIDLAAAAIALACGQRPLNAASLTASGDLVLTIPAQRAFSAASLHDE